MAINTLLLSASASPAASALVVSTPAKKLRFTLLGWVFLIAVPGLAVTTAISGLLLYWGSSGTTFSGAFYWDVINNRATVQLFVQVFAHFLGLIHMYVLTKLFNLFTVQRLQTRPITLDCLKWWNSMCQLQLDTSLSLRYCIPLTLTILLSLVPAALWAGALTPVPVPKVIFSNFSIPFYGADPQNKFWNQSATLLNPDVNRSSYGSFSYNPVLTILGSLLDNAAAATAPNTSTQTHRKLDNTGYTYHGRSYGVGASIGLTEFPQPGMLQNFTFLESGYTSNITCWYNHTMDFHVEQVSEGSAGYPYMWWATGYISDGGYENVLLPGYGDSEIVALLGHNPQWGIATGQNATKYAQVNQTSCAVTFNKQTFVAAVDNVQHNITVSALQDNNDMAGLNTTNPVVISSGVDMSQMIYNLVEEIGLIFQASDSPKFSPLGSALISNIANTNASQASGVLPSTLNATDLALRGIASSLESMIDDILIAFSSAQFVIAGDENHGRMFSPVKATLLAVKIGDQRFIIGISVINALIVLIFAFEAVRNRGWVGSTLFDYRDLKSLAVGISSNGIENMKAVEGRLEQGKRNWVGDPTDATMGQLEVLLKSTSGGVTLTLAGRANDVQLLERDGTGQVERD